MRQQVGTNNIGLRLGGTYRRNSKTASSKLLICLSEKECKSWKGNLLVIVAFAVIGTRVCERD